MNTEEYEKAKQECWKKFKVAFDTKGSIPTMAFIYVFSEAYYFGMEAAKKEREPMTNKECQTASMRQELEKDRNEPKFKVGDVCMCDGRVARILEYIPGSEFPYTVHILQTNNKIITNESDLESFTKPKEEMQKESKEKENNFASDNKYFDNILKDGFQNHNRLQIAAMAMQGLLNATSVERFTLRINPETIAEAAFEYADALISEAQKGGEE